jgi:hypothetical protein
MIRPVASKRLAEAISRNFKTLFFGKLVVGVVGDGFVAWLYFQSAFYAAPCLTGRQARHDD